MKHCEAEYEKPQRLASRSETRNLSLASRRIYPVAWKYGDVAVPPGREVPPLKCATWNRPVFPLP
jgi:hypothetical protein